MKNCTSLQNHLKTCNICLEEKIRACREIKTLKLKIGDHFEMQTQNKFLQRYLQTRLQRLKPLITRKLKLVHFILNINLEPNKMFNK